MRRSVVIGIAVFVLAAAGTAGAAAVAVTSAHLSSYSAASTVPVSTCTATATADTYADSASASSNFGSSAALVVRNNQAARAFVQFDLASCPPAGALVKTATLSLYLSTAPTSNRTYDVHRVTAAWTETGLTWNAPPAAASSATASVATGSTNGVTLQWNVAADVLLFAGGTANFGWRIKDRGESGGARTGSLASREAATQTQHPTLTITYYN